MSKKEVSFKGRLEQQQAMAYLNELVTGLKTGTVYVQNGDGYVSLSPGKLINIEIEAVEKKDKEKLVIEMTWGRDEEVAEDAPLAATVHGRGQPAEDFYLGTGGGRIRGR